MAIEGREGLCYRYTYEIAKKSMIDDTDDEIVIVHGRATDPISGEKINNHAWVEFVKENTVIDPTLSDGPIDKIWYYQMYKPIPEKRYTPEDLLILSMRNKFVGKYHNRRANNSKSILKRAQKISGVKMR